MPAATGESNPGIDHLPKIRELEERLDNFRIQVADDMTIRGSAWQGYALNSLTCGEMTEGQGGGPPPPPNPGACCLPDGSCEVVTPGQCLLDGGTFHGGDCDPNPCEPTATGACCTGTDCTVETNADCTDMGGLYRGDGTTCDDVDCTQGACCAPDGSCSITTEAGCEGYYQGNGTTCSPNPCELVPCCEGGGFAGFLGVGNYYKTRAVHFSYSVSSFPYDESQNITTITNCDGGVSCSGGCHFSDGIISQDGHWVSDGGGGCLYDPTCNVFFGCSPLDTGMVISDTEFEQTCPIGGPSHMFGDGHLTITLSDPCIPM